MGRIYFNQQVSPRLFKTNKPPSANTQEFFYENHLEDRLKELDEDNQRVLKNIDTLKDDQHQQKEQGRHIQNRLDQLFKLFTSKINDIVSQITDIKKTNAKQNDTHTKNYETQQVLLESIDERQQKIEQQQNIKFEQAEVLIKELDRKIEELTTQVADIKKLSATLTDDYEAQQALLKSMNERQLKFEENQHEDIDLTQLLFQELTKKINQIPSHIDEIKNASAKQTDTLLENHELQQAMLQSIDERQLKMEARQRQSISQEDNEQNKNETGRATQSV
jgi:hypothetical protein